MNEQDYDCAACTITLFNNNGNIILSEPGLMALILSTNMPLAIGKEAKSVSKNIAALRDTDLMKHKIDPADIAVISPLNYRGEVDIELTRRMFWYFLHTGKAIKSHGLIKPSVALFVCSELAQLDCSAIMESLIRAGAKEVILFDGLFSGAIDNIPASFKWIIEISYRPFV
jgi:actin-like ATPase involved in cell morphogenesis